MKRRVAVVVGPDRCGTSLLAQFLHLLGVEMGDQLLPANENNEDGYWEHEPIIRAQDKILIALGRWHRTNLLPLPNAWWRKPEIKPHVDELRAVIEKNNSAFKGLWGFKDPRTARLLPLWQQLFQEYSLAPVYFLAVRNPASAIDSFVKRNQFSPAVSEMIWTVHMMDSIAYTDGKAHVIHYERWFSNALEQLAALQSILDINWPGEPWELEDATAKIIKSSLNHNSNPIHAVRNQTTSELYDLLLKSSSDCKLLPESLELAKCFRENQRQFSAWSEQFDGFWNLLTERLGDYFPNVWRELKTKSYVQFRADFEQSNELNSKLKKESNQCHKLLEEKQGALESLEKQFKKEQDRAKGLEKQLAEKQALLKEADNKAAKGQTQVRELEKQVASAQGLAEKNEQQLAQERARARDFEKQLQDANAKNEKRAARIKELEKQVASAQDLVRKNEQLIDQEKGQTREISEQLKDIRNQLNVVENLHVLKHKKINALEERLQVSQARVSELQDHLDETRNRLDIVEKLHALKHKKIVELQGIQARANELQEHLDDTRKRLDVVERLHALKHKKINVLEERLQDNLAQAGELQDQLNDTRKRLEDAEGSLTLKLKEIVELEERLQDSNAKTLGLDEQMQAASARAGEMERLHAEALSRLAELEQMHESSLARTGEVETRMAECQANAEKFEALLAESQADARTLEQNLRRLEEAQRQFVATREYGSDQRPMDKIMPRHADYATATFPSLASVLEGADLTFRKLKICILTRDIFGPVRNGGIGTAWGHASTFLASQGHDVTIAYTLGLHCPCGELGHWIDYYKAKGISFVPVPEPEVSSAQGFLSSNLDLAWKAYEYLKNTEFDIVHVSEWSGDGYFCLMAKKLGLAFRNTIICVKTSSPTHWNTVGNNFLVQEKTQLLRAHIERKSVEYADIVISPSHHMLRWMLEWGYNVPRERCFVQPNIMPAPSHWTMLEQPRRLDKIKEIVFFGRLDPRKGLEVFCKALSQLRQKRPIGVKVTFLGISPKAFDGEGFITEQAKEWDFEHQVLSGLNSKEAVEYLSQDDRLAVMPSLLDNSPFGVYECLAAQIPFLASDRGGTPELVHEADRPDVIFEPLPQRLAACLEQALDKGIIIARPSFDFVSNLDIWGKFHLALGNNKRLCEPQAQIIEPIGDVTPIVSVCVAHFNRPEMLAKAIDSIKAQTYKNIEVVIGDDGSTLPEAHQYLDSIERDFASRGWKIVRQDNRYNGAVRNTAVRHSSGEYILFMDDDNIAKPHEVEAFVKAALASKADVLTCFADTFTSEDQVASSTPLRRILFLGDSVSLGVLTNCFGDTNCLISRRAFNEIGGFTEDYGVGKEDYEFFARAVLQGLKLYVVPEALYWYRQGNEKVKAKHFFQGTYAGELRAFRPYFQTVPLCFHEVLRYALGCDKQITIMLPTVKAAGAIKADFEKLKKLIPN